MTDIGAEGEELKDAVQNADSNRDAQVPRVRFEKCAFQDIELAGSHRRLLLKRVTEGRQQLKLEEACRVEVNVERNRIECRINWVHMLPKVPEVVWEDDRVIEGDVGVVCRDDYVVRRLEDVDPLKDRRWQLADGISASLVLRDESKCEVVVPMRDQGSRLFVEEREHG